MKHKCFTVLFLKYSNIRHLPAPNSYFLKNRAHRTAGQIATPRYWANWARRTVANTSACAGLTHTSSCAQDSSLCNVSCRTLHTSACAGIMHASSCAQDSSLCNVSCRTLPYLHFLHILQAVGVAAFPPRAVSRSSNGRAVPTSYMAWHISSNGI